MLFHVTEKWKTNQDKILYLHFYAFREAALTKNLPGLF